MSVYLRHLMCFSVTLKHMRATAEPIEATSIWNREEAAMNEGLLSVGPITWTRDEIHTRLGTGYVGDGLRVLQNRRGR